MTCYSRSTRKTVHVKVLSQDRCMAHTDGFDDEPILNCCITLEYCRNVVTLVKCVQNHTNNIVEINNRKILVDT